MIIMNLSEALKKLPLVAILRGITPNDAVKIGHVLVKAGFTCIEVPLNSPNALESINLLAKEFSSVAIIGAGTVTNSEQVHEIAEQGGKLIVTPHVNSEIIHTAKMFGLYSIPGFFTASEAFSAINAGADALKLFPAEAASPSVLKALKAVLPNDIPVLPVGGITPGRMAEYHAAGAAGFGLGSALYKPNDSAEEVTKKAQAFIEKIKSLKF